MSNWQQTLYDRAPWPLKEWLVAAEARRRNRYRRYGDYERIKREYDLAAYERLSWPAIQERQLARLQTLLDAARRQNPFYRSRLPETVNSLEDFAQVPILTKDDVRQHTDAMIAEGYPAKHLWTAATSGSTGTPLVFSVGREGIRARFAIQDNYYARFGCPYGERRVRFGGSKIAPAERRQPPFWIMNRVDNQLQMSSYHMDEDALPFYIEKMNAFAPLYITGYAHAVYNFAHFVNTHGGLNVPLRAVFLDSEGVPPHYVPVIEAGLNTTVHEIYGIGETGWIAVQGSDRRYHVLALSCVLEVVDAAGKPLPYGESGRLIVTDLTQSAVPYIRYDTGDIGTLLPPDEDGDMNTPILDAIDGRSDEIIVTPKGRRVGRLSHVTKPGKGILESQIAHVAPDRIEIRVVPTPDFDETSMAEVVHVAQHLLGEDMIVEWKRVTHIERTRAHKFRHVVREF